ncbi:hypothetical protein ACIQ9K_35585 [Streptomyces microflavus]|uniref:hypothetical protein n=1 Tax=Streptomyces microflavus TaxID=1919 RepID=UPI0037FFA654
MPKKRKKNRKTSRGSAAAVVSRALLPAQLADVPDCDAECCDDENFPVDEDFPMSAFREQFASPAGAAAAVREDKRWEWVGCIDGSRMRHRILASDDGTAAVEQAVFLGTTQEGAILCAWHETPDGERPALKKNILSALDRLQGALRPHLEAEIREGRDDDYTALVPEAFCDAPEPYGAGIPLFGWRILHPVTPETTWEDTLDIALWNSSIAIGDWSGHYDHVDEISLDGFTRLLRHHGIPAVLCAECERPITSRHPRWPGIWATPTDEGGGASCEGKGTGPFPPAPRLGWYTDSEFGTPHQPQSAS